MQNLLASFNQVQWPAILLAAAEFACLGGAWVLAFRGGRRPGLALRIVLLVLSARFVLFATPLSWYGYYTALGQEYVDPRERDIISNRVKAFLAPPEQQRFLAVGSSQTRAIYSEFSKSNPLVGYYVLAGMGPLDYFTQYDEIRSRNPGSILLFVSEFDLARKVDLDDIRLSDLPIRQWPVFYRIAAAVAGPDAAWRALTQVAVAYVFPEAKYSFIAADFARQAMASLTGNRLHLPTVAEQYRAQMTSLAELDSRYIPNQARFLDAFLARAAQDGIPVVMIAGQYNPEAYTPTNVAMYRDVVRPLLADMQHTYPNVTVVDRSQTVQFSAKDYLDGYHIDTSKGPAFVSSVVKMIER